MRRVSRRTCCQTKGPFIHYGLRTVIFRGRCTDLYRQKELSSQTNAFTYSKVRFICASARLQPPIASILVSLGVNPRGGHYNNNDCGDQYIRPVIRGHGYLHSIHSSDVDMVSLWYLSPTSTVPSRGGGKLSVTFWQSIQCLGAHVC